MADDDNRPVTGGETNLDVAMATVEAQAGDTPPPPPPDPEPVEDDIDATELANALAAVEAEKAASGETPPEPQPGQQAPPEPKAESPMIPKARFDEVLQQQQELARRAAYLEGQLAARTAAPPPPGTGEPPAPASPDPIKTLREEMKALASKFDDGEITASEWEEQKAAKQEQIELLREEQLLAKVMSRQEPTQVSLADEHFIKTRSDELTREHPFAQLVPDEDFEFIKARAIHALGPQWQQKPRSATKDMELREKVAELSDHYGPKIMGMTLEQAKAKLAGTSQQPSVPGLSQEARNRQQKLDLARDMPPDLASMNGSPGNLTPTDSQIMSMTDEDIIANIPAATRQKIMESGGF